MNSTILNVMILNDVVIVHSLSLDDDSTQFNIEDSDETILKVSSTGQVFNQASKQVGSFSLDNRDLWFFRFSDSEEIISTPNKDLIKAETRILKELIDRKIIKLD